MSSQEYQKCIAQGFGMALMTWQKQGGQPTDFGPDAKLLSCTVPLVVTPAVRKETKDMFPRLMMPSDGRRVTRIIQASSKDGEVSTNSSNCTSFTAVAFDTWRGEVNADGDNDC
jgi:hypothetical protein